MAILAAGETASRDGQGFQWRDAFERVVSAGGPESIDASAAPRAYPRHPPPGYLDYTVEDAPPSDYERRYSTGEPADPLAVIALSWQQSLRSPPESTEPAAPAHRVQTASLRFLFDKHRPASVLVLGPDPSADLELCRRLAASAGAPLHGRSWHEIAEPPRLDRMFDVVLCLSPLDPEPTRPERWLDAIARHAETLVVFTAPGPSGSIASWLEQWSRRQWHPHLVDTLAMRCLATTDRLRRDLIVLSRTGSEGSAASLLRIGRPAASPAQ